MYGKHFQSMYSGSMVGMGAIPFAVWGYIISHQQPPNFDVELNPKILAVIIGEEEMEVAKAIEQFCQPDPKSRTEANEGRKLVRLGEYLFHVVNGKQYNDIRTNEERREYWREQKRRKRVETHPPSPPVNPPAPLDKPPKLRADTSQALAIYDAYPKKVSRPDALRAITKALTKIDFEKLLNLTQKYAQARIGEPDQYTPHPATWFNAERFNDDPATWKSNLQTSKPNPRNLGVAKAGPSYGDAARAKLERQGVVPQVAQTGNDGSAGAGAIAV